MPAGIRRFFDRVKLGGGHEEERRALAKKVNVDSYTANPILAEKLTSVAWITFSARAAVNITTSVRMPYSMVMSTVSLTNNMVWDTKPADFLAMNPQKAKDMGASDEQAQALISNQGVRDRAGGDRRRQRGSGALHDGQRPDARPSPRRIGWRVHEGSPTASGN